MSQKIHQAAASHIRQRRLAGRTAWTLMRANLVAGRQIGA